MCPRLNYSGPPCRCKHTRDVLKHILSTLGTAGAASERTRNHLNKSSVTKVFKHVLPSSFLSALDSFPSPFQTIASFTKPHCYFCRLVCNKYTLPCPDFEPQSFTNSLKPISKAVDQAKWHQARSTRTPAPSLPSLMRGNAPIHITTRPPPYNPPPPQ